MKRGEVEGGWVLGGGERDEEWKKERNGASVIALTTKDEKLKRMGEMCEQAKGFTRVGRYRQTYIEV